MTLAEYIHKRNGVPMGSTNSLRNNLYRSLGAKNFSTFWNYWNPIFGYYLGNFVFKPLKKILPVSFSFICTFIVCGLIHDAVTTLVRGKLSWFFTIWFAFMGFAVLVTKFFNQNFSSQRWLVRALANISIISLCFLLTLYITKFLLAK